MKNLCAIIFFTTIHAFPASADVDLSPHWSDRLSEGFSGELGENLLEDFRQFSEEMAPLLDDLSERFRGLGGYHAPEVLPNGDIIIRRKEGQIAPDETPENEDGGAIEL